MEKIDWEKTIERMCLWQWWLAAVAMAAGVGIRVVFWKSLPPELPVFYSLPWGEDQLAEPEWLMLPLVMAITVAGIATAIVVKIKKNEVLAAITAATGVMTEVILILAVLRTVIQLT